MSFTRSGGSNRGRAGLGGESGVDDVRANLEPWHLRQVSVGRRVLAQLGEVMSRGRRLRDRARGLREQAAILSPGPAGTGAEAEMLQRQIRDLDERIRRQERLEREVQAAVLTTNSEIEAFHAEMDAVAARCLQARAEAVFSAIEDLTDLAVSQQPDA